MHVGAVILAGGESSRMGRDKAALTLAGETFLQRLAAELSGLDERLISVARPGQQLLPPGWTEVPDRFSGCGPLGGLHAALCACRSEALVAVSCDTPLFSQKLARRLIAGLTPEYDAAAAVGPDGRLHPLCAVYRKGCLPVLEEQLRAGDYRLRAALERLRLRRVDLAEAGISPETVANVNTPEAYARLLARLGQN